MSKRYGIVKGCAGSHDGRAGDDAVEMSANDASIDAARETKIVRIDDEASHSLRIFISLKTNHITEQREPAERAARGRCKYLTSPR